MQLKDSCPIELKSKQHVLDLVHVLLTHEAEDIVEYTKTA